MNRRARRRLGRVNLGWREAEPAMKIARPNDVRAHTPSLVLAGAAAGVIMLVGCGTAAAPGTAHSGSGSPVPAKVSLTFTVTSSGQTPRHWTLRCDPPGGSQPDPAAACRALLTMKQPFEPPAKHLACPMIMMSDRTITVTGTWFGQQVHRVITDGGCDLNLFGKIFRLSG